MIPHETELFEPKAQTNKRAKVLAHILLFEVSDPRLDMVTITGCEVSFDRSMCNVYYTVDPSRYEDAAAGSLPLMAAFVRSWDAPCIGE